MNDSANDAGAVGSGPYWTPRRSAAAIAVGVAVGIFAIWSIQPVGRIIPDGLTYHFQAQVFAQGKWRVPCVPGERRLLPSGHMCLHGGYTMAKYPIGHPLLLVPGVWLGNAWLVPAAATGLAVWFLFLLVSEVYGQRVALWSAALAAVSPATITLGLTTMSETSSRMLLALYLLGMVRWLKRGGWGYALTAGMALGFAFNCRPLTAVGFGAVGGALWLYALARGYGAGRRAVMRGLAPALVGFALFFSLYPLWNYAHSGHPWQPAFTDQSPGDRLGFGQRWEGFSPDPPAMIFEHSPREARRRLFANVLPAVAHYSVGIGGYSKLMWNFWDVRAWASLSMFGFGLLYLVALVPLLHPTRGIGDLVFLALLVGNFALYALHFRDPTTYESIAFGVRYHCEALMLGLIPLLARGGGIVARWIGRMNASTVTKTLAGGVFLAALAANNIGVTAKTLRVMAGMDGSLATLPDLADRLAETPAVVYLDGAVGIFMPLYEYPLVPMEGARVVFCLAGRTAWYGLPDEEWESIHRRLFPDRTAWRFMDTEGPARLVRLHPETPR